MNKQNKQEERDNRIFSKLNLKNLTYKLTYDHFKELSSGISKAIYNIDSFRIKSKPLQWCFSNIKKNKIFMLIFHANEAGREIYKEEISKNIPEYSYKTIAKIIDEGFSKGYYIALKPDGESGTDTKIKNIRPSEELIIDFLNLCIETMRIIEQFSKKNKTVD